MQPTLESKETCTRGVLETGHYTVKATEDSKSPSGLEAHSSDVQSPQDRSRKKLDHLPEPAFKEKGKFKLNVALAYTLRVTKSQAKE